LLPFAILQFIFVKVYLCCFWPESYCNLLQITVLLEQSM